MKVRGSKTMCVVPSRHGRRSSYSNLPFRDHVKRPAAKSQYEDLKDYFEAFNTAGCPLH